MNEFFKTGAFIQLDPDRFMIGFGTLTRHQEPPKNSPAFYAPDFFLKDQAPFWAFENVAEYARDELLALLKSPIYGSRDWQKPDFNVFQKQYYSLQTLIKDGSLVKGVPYTYVRSPGTLHPDELRHCLFSLIVPASKPRNDWAYGIWDHEKGMLGATPEVLFDVKSNDLLTMACGGTCSLESLDEPLLKEKEEHRLIVEGIVSSLRSFGELSIDPLKITKLASFAHLVTPIRVKLSNKASFLSLIAALHPTPALGAYPKLTGQKWLESINTMQERQRFGAPFAYCSASQDRLLCLVAIRNLAWDQNSCSIFAGAGVTSESTLEGEWNEVNLKIESVKARLSIP